MVSYKEDRIKKITQLYYSRPEIQKALFEFSKNREICPRYFEGFGKRPDSFQYLGDIFEMVKKGATSFNCSEELWKDPLKIRTGMSEEEANELRIGWDLLIDIDSKYIDYSKVCTKVIIDFLKFHGIKNIGVKFSGSKGFHILIPWASFPKEINQIQTKNMFPEWARIIIKYITEQIKNQLIKKVSDLEHLSNYIKDFQIPEKVMPDLILVSPRHLFRMPYSLHEKTALASIVIDKEKIMDFDLKNANPLKAEVISFLPDIKKEEASELLIEALDWNNMYNQSKKEVTENIVYSPVNISDLRDSIMPPTIKKILEGLSDGRKRALFVLLNFFRSLGLSRPEVEKRIYGWNEKNSPPLQNNYIKVQIAWNYRNKIIPPPNYDKDFYKNIGIIPTNEEIRYKNPVNFISKKYFDANKNL